MDALVARYGLIAVAAGSGIEGEPFALAGGILAQRGSVPMWAASAAAIAGAVFVDQGWFFLARRLRDNRLVGAVARRPAFARGLALLERHPLGFLLLFRFAYGVRAVAPVAIGASRVAALPFILCEFAAALVWGIAFTGLGYLAGPLFERLSARYGTAIEIMALLLSIAVLTIVLRGGRTRRASVR